MCFHCVRTYVVFFFRVCWLLFCWFSCFIFHFSLCFFFLVCSCSVHRRLSFRCDSTLFPLRFVLHTNNTIHQQQQRQQLWLFNVHCYTNSFGYEIFGTNELCTQGLSNKVRKTHTKKHFSIKFQRPRIFCTTCSLLERKRI